MIFYVIKRSVLRVGSVHMQIEIWKDWCTSDTDSKSNVSSVGSSSELLSVSAVHQPLHLINLIFLEILVGWLITEGRVRKSNQELANNKYYLYFLE